MTEKAPEEQAAEIRATRRQLAATVEALVERTDVRTRTRAAVRRRLGALRAKGERLKARLRTSRGR